jgi:hypothetical protein
MAIELTKAIKLVGQITNLAKGMANRSTEVKINEVAIHLQNIVLDLQAEMMMIQSNYQEVLRTKEDLEKKLAEDEKWDKERARYHLQKIGTEIGAIGFAYVYALKAGQNAGEPDHWLCARCYNDKKKSILQPTPSASWWVCPECEHKSYIIVSGEIV